MGRHENKWIEANEGEKKHIHETLFSHAFRYNTYMYELLLHPNNFNNNNNKTHEPIFYFHKNIDVRLKCCIIVCNLFYWSTFACVAFDSFVLSWGHWHHEQWTCFVWNKIWCAHVCICAHCLAGTLDEFDFPHLQMKSCRTI